MRLRQIQHLLDMGYVARWINSPDSAERRVILLRRGLTGIYGFRYIRLVWNALDGYRYEKSNFLSWAETQAQFDLPSMNWTISRYTWVDGSRLARQELED